MPAPFGTLGVRCTDAALSGLEFLPPDAPLLPPQGVLAVRVAAQLAAYFADPGFHFDVPLAPGGTAHQCRVWQRMSTIPRGQVLTYGELARDIGSAPRAVGQACGNNPIPLIIPCHRVVGKAGLGGFMHHDRGYALEIKHWLLRHEGYLHD